MKKVYVLMYNWTDGFMSSSDGVIGVYDSRQLAMNIIEDDVDVKNSNYEGYWINECYINHKLSDTRHYPKDELKDPLTSGRCTNNVFKDLL